MAAVARFRRNTVRTTAASARDGDAGGAMQRVVEAVAVLAARWLLAGSLAARPVVVGPSAKLSCPPSAPRTLEVPRCHETVPTAKITPPPPPPPSPFPPPTTISLLPLSTSFPPTPGIWSLPHASLPYVNVDTPLRDSACSVANGEWSCLCWRPPSPGWNNRFIVLFCHRSEGHCSFSGIVLRRM